MDEAEQTSVTSARIDAIGLISSDLGRTVAFYRALGCDVGDPDDSGHLTCELGGVRLMFDTEDVMRSFAPDTWNGTSAGRLTLAARCPEASGVDRLYERLSGLGRGSLTPPFDAPWGQRYATVLDPDGVRVDLYADR